MRIQDIAPKSETKYSELVMQVVAAFLLSWAAVAFLSGCTVDQVQAYKIIRGVK